MIYIILIWIIIIHQYLLERTIIYSSDVGRYKRIEMYNIIIVRFMGILYYRFENIPPNLIYSFSDFDLFGNNGRRGNIFIYPMHIYDRKLKRKLQKYYFVIVKTILYRYNNNIEYIISLFVILYIIYFFNKKK